MLQPRALKGRLIKQRLLAINVDKVAIDIFDLAVKYFQKPVAIEEHMKLKNA